MNDLSYIQNPRPKPLALRSSSWLEIKKGVLAYQDGAPLPAPVKTAFKEPSALPGLAIAVCFLAAVIFGTVVVVANWAAICHFVLISIVLVVAGLGWLFGHIFAFLGRYPVIIVPVPVNTNKSK